MQRLNSPSSDSEADAATREAHPAVASAPSEILEPIDYARKLVTALLPATGLMPAIDPRTLHVFIGEGNWISYECSFYPHPENSCSGRAGVLNASVAKRLDRIERSQKKLAWFRTRTRPSLHFCIAFKDGHFALKGHVDAAAPGRNPLVHLVHDYLPAHGIGEHPTPRELWVTFVR
jgi:hypothetical protein